MARTKIVLNAFFELIIKLNQVDSLHHAAENLASDNIQPGIQVVQQPDGRFFIRDYDLQTIVKRLQPYCQFANYG